VVTRSDGEQFALQWYGKVSTKTHEKRDGSASEQVVVTCKRQAHIFPEPSKDHNNDWLAFDGHV
jgi:hypothetical protein